MSLTVVQKKKKGILELCKHDSVLIYEYNELI